MTTGPERRAEISLTNEQINRVPEALASFIRQQPKKPPIEEITKYRSAETLFIKAFKRAADVDAVLNGMEVAVNDGYVNRQLFVAIRNDVLLRMEADPVNLVAEEYWRRRHEDVSESELMPLIPRISLRWAEPLNLDPRLLEMLDNTAYTGTDARLLRILKTTQGGYALVRDDIEALASPLLFSPSIIPQLAEFGQTIERDHHNWELVIATADNPSEEGYTLRRKERRETSLKEIPPPVEDERRPAYIVVGADNNRLLINGDEFYLTQPGNYRGPKQNTRRDALFLLTYLNEQKNQQRWICHEELQAVFRAKLEKDEPAVLVSTVNQNSYINARINNARKIVLGLHINDEPLVSFIPTNTATKTGMEIGVFNFNLQLEHELLG